MLEPKKKSGIVIALTLSIDANDPIILKQVTSLLNRTKKPATKPNEVPPTVTAISELEQELETRADLYEHDMNLSEFQEILCIIFNITVVTNPTNNSGDGDKGNMREREITC